MPKEVIANEQNPLAIDQNLPKRDTARMILVDSSSRILLIKIEDNSVQTSSSSGAKKRPFWITPGGKIEEGESMADALARELFEETGITADRAIIGQCLGFGSHVLDWKGVQTTLNESFYSVLIKSEEVSTDHMTEDEKAVFQKYKWWTLEELRSSREIFLPVNLFEIAQVAITNKSLGQPLEVDMSTPKSLYY